MKDADVKAGMQAAAREMARRFPGRVFTFFVFGADEGDTSHYVSNGGREEVMRAMLELRASGLPGIPPGDTSRS